MEALKINKQALIMNKSNVVSGEFQAALHAKCPRCRRGDMFTGPAYGLKLQKMNETCPHCNLKFEREPGYFYVAMFVSYAMNVLQMIAVGLTTFLITKNQDDPILYMFVIFPAVFILSPFNYRYSRVILLYWLTPGLRYNPEASKDKA